jgi:hypothetical protein
MPKTKGGDCFHVDVFMFVYAISLFTYFDVWTLLV